MNDGLYRPGRSAQRRIPGPPQRSRLKAPDREYQWNDPDIQDAARRAGVRPWDLARQTNLDRLALSGPMAERQWQGWVDCQNRARAKRGQPPMSQDEIEAAWSEWVGSTIRRSVENLTRNR